MTSGTSGSPPPNGNTSTGAWSYRTWTGTNGKYEPVPGGYGIREKWNNYSVAYLSSSMAANKFVLAWQHAPPPPFYSPPHSGTMDVTVNVDQQWSSNTPSPVPSNSVKEKVLRKLLEEVKGHSFNLGVEIGQLNQTVGLLSGNLRKLGRAALALKRGDFATAARQLGSRPRGTRLKPSDVSGRWLELQYGWLPLLSSSFEACQAFHAISKGPRSHVFHVTSADRFTLDLSLDQANQNCLVQAMAGRSLKYEMYEELSVARQLGLVDPLSVAWELTPWSFVVDWFIPFGTYLDLLHQIPSLKGRWLITDFGIVPKQKAIYRWNIRWAFWPYGTIKVLSTPSSVHQITRVTRTFSNSPPPVPLPRFQWGLNSPKRFWNAIALAHSRFTK